MEVVLTMATGKVSEQSRPSVKSSAPNSRTNRKHIANLQRNKKKDEVLFSKRLGSNAGPPKIVVRLKKKKKNRNLQLVQIFTSVIFLFENCHE